MLLCLFLVLACVYDYGFRRIPNLLVLFICVTGFAVSGISQGVGGMGRYLLCALLTMGLLYFPFRIGVLGAGDVKLLGVCAGFYSGRVSVRFVCAAFVFAAVAALVKLLLERSLQKSLLRFRDYVMRLCAQGKWQMYFEDNGERRRAGICLAGPMLCSAFWCNAFVCGGSFEKALHIWGGIN